MNLEKYAYNYATSKGYDIPKYYDADGKLIQRMHVKDLFDMLTGTSTGSILASALSLKSKTDSSAPRYWATDANEIYINSADDLF